MSKRESKVILVVAAHPDDELLGGGATFAKRLRLGDEVHAVVVCEGESVRYTPTGKDVQQQSHAQQAAEALGFTSFHCLMMPDQRLDKFTQLEINQKFEAVIDEVRPSIVYTHYAGDVNRDHQIIHDSIMVATRPGRSVSEVYGFETASATGMWTGHAFDPDTFEVVSEEDLERKLTAMKCYVTESPPFPHPRSVESLRHRAHYWGNIIHEVAAEPFMTLRRIVGKS